MSLAQVSPIRPHQAQRATRYRCGKCQMIGTVSDFRSGRGRHYGEHSDYHYCGGCGSAMPTWRTDWQVVK